MSELIAGLLHLGSISRQSRLYPRILVDQCILRIDVRGVQLIGLENLLDSLAGAARGLPKGFVFESDGEGRITRLSHERLVVGHLVGRREPLEVFDIAFAKRYRCRT